MPGAKPGDVCTIRGVPRQALGFPSNWTQCTVLRQVASGEKVPIPDYTTLCLDAKGLSEPMWLVEGPALRVFSDNWLRTLAVPQWVFLDRYLYPQKPVDDRDIYGYVEDDVDPAALRRELEKM